MKFYKDVDDNQFWLTVWSLVIVGVVAIATIIGFVSYKEDLLIKQLVEKGKDPMELTCLYHPSTVNEIPCLILAQKKAGILNEFTIAFHHQKIIGILVNSGGITNMIEQIAEICDKKGEKENIVYSSDPDELVKLVIDKLNQ